MPDDNKVPLKPRYKVEEVEAETPETPKEEEKKITSFSTLDTPAPLVKEPKLEAPAKVDPEPKEDEDHESETKPVPEVEEVPHEETPQILETPLAEPEKPEENDEIKKWLEQTPTDTATTSTKPSGGKGKFVALFLAILIIGALGGGIYYYRANVEQSGQTENQSKEESTEAQTGTPEETTAPTPTTVAVDFSKYKVQILNGGGVAGEAGKAQGYLEAVGFKSFKTGNASTFTYTDTEVSLKKDTPDEVFAQVKTALEKYYTGVVKTDKALPDSSEFDLQVTVGKKK